VSSRAGSVSRNVWGGERTLVGDTKEIIGKTISVHWRRIGGFGGGSEIVYKGGKDRYGGLVISGRFWYKNWIGKNCVGGCTRRSDCVGRRYGSLPELMLDARGGAKQKKSTPKTLENFEIGWRLV